MLKLASDEDWITVHLIGSDHEKTLKKAAQSGELEVLNSVTLRPLELAVGALLDGALVTVSALRSFIKGRNGEVELQQTTAKEQSQRETQASRSSPVNWKFWLLMPEVRIWEACALSLDVEPRNMIPERNGWMAGPGTGPFFVPSSFRTKALHEEFEDRMRLLLAWRENPTHFTPGTLDRIVPGKTMVRLPEFVAWAAALGIELPAELFNLIDKGAPRAEEPCSIPEPTTIDQPPAGRSSDDVPSTDQIKRNRQLALEAGVRGAKGLILERWDEVEALHGPRADGNQVLRVLKRRLDTSDKIPELKTVQNHLITLRKEKLIP